VIKLWLRKKECPACGAAKGRQVYLCKGCWFQLPPVSRERLSLHDPRAARRLLELLKQIKAGAPLELIDIDY